MESSNDSTWESLREEAEQAGKNERLLVAYLEETIHGQKSFDTALSYTLASKLRDEILPGITLHDLFLEILESEESMRESILIDLEAVKDRDPAANGYLNPFLFSRAFTPYRPIGSPIIFGTRSGKHLLSICRV